MQRIGNKINKMVVHIHELAVCFDPPAHVEEDLCPNDYSRGLVTTHSPGSKCERESRGARLAVQLHVGPHVVGAPRARAHALMLLHANQSDDIFPDHAPFAYNV